MGIFNPVEARFEASDYKKDSILQDLLRKSRFAIKDFEEKLDQYAEFGDEIYVGGDVDEVGSAAHLNMVLDELTSEFDRRESSLSALA